MYIGCRTSGLLERVLNLSDHRHRFDGIGRLGEALHFWRADPHKRINLLLFGDRGRHRWLANFALRLAPLNLGQDVSIIRLNVVAKLQVLGGIFVAAVNVRLIGELREFLNQRSVHLLGGAFEEPAAASQEKRIASEHSFVVTSRRLHKITNMTLKRERLECTKSI